MARSPTFDRETVLDHAVACFWRHGYEGTSVQDLVAATGLGRGSLYAAFGDKRGVFEAALDRYRTVVSARLFAPLDAPGADMDAIREVLRRLATVDRKAPAPGCLLTNTVCEAGPRDPAFAASVRLAFEGVERRFETALEGAATRGQLRPGVVPADAALFLLGTAQGLRVLARAGETAARLETVARTALAALSSSSIALERTDP